jgi:hypothetical protein
LKEKSADDVIGCANGMFDLTILLGCIWEGKTKKDIVRVTKDLKFGIVEFAAIVTLNCLKGDV